MFGFININKPINLTSHDVIHALRRITKIKQIGHGGTIDKLACGVLPVAIGKATRLLQFLPSNKTYLATIILGLNTDTYDLDGKVLNDCSQSLNLSHKQISDTLNTFIGDTLQKPPLYSACKLNGKRLSDHARSNNTIDEIKSRPITINDIKLLNVSLPEITIEVNCMGGTYIRSLAYDLGMALNCQGACLKFLQRNQSGIFKIESAFSLNQIQEALSDDPKLSSIIKSPQEILAFTNIETNNDTTIADINNGKSIAKGLLGLNENFTERHISLSNNGKLFAVLEGTVNNQYHPKIVFK